MKRYFKSLILIAVLATIVIYLNLGKRSMSISDEYINFAVQDTAEIDKIEITGLGNGIKLEKQDHRWLLNEKYNVRQKAMRAALTTLLGLQMKSRVMKQKEAEIAEYLKKNAVKVSVFRKGKTLKSFLVGKDVVQLKASIMQLDDAPFPFLVENLGTYGSVRKIFSLSEMYWRDKTVFSYRFDEIAAITVEYPKYNESSFKISKKENAFVLWSLQAQKMIPNADAESIGLYVSYFNNVKYDAITTELDKHQKDSLRAAKPEVIISVEDVFGQKNTIKTYLRPNTNPETKNQYVYDIYKMYGFVNDNQELVLVDYLAFDPLYRHLKDFLIRN